MVVGFKHSSSGPETMDEVIPLGWEFSGQPSSAVAVLVDGLAALDDPRPNRTAEKEDASLIAALYRKEGPQFVARLRGSFAIALWDFARRRLLLAVDRFGTRPLYYWSAGGRCAFAPRISCFAGRPEIPRRIDPNSLYFYINHSFVPAPFTIYRDIHRLEPGQYLLWETGNTSIGQYWDMSYPEDYDLDEESAAELVRSSVADSVRFLLGNETRPSEEVGAFLSGGTDSSTVLGLMSRMTARRVKSFSVGFDETRYNEIHYARIAAQQFNSLAHEIFVRPNDALEALPLMAKEYDEPFGNSSAIPTYFCLKAAREAGVKVMFAGDGGDELFGGNERYLTEKVFSLYHGLPRPLRKATDAAAHVLPALYPFGKLRNYIRRANLPVADRFFSYQLFFRDHANEFLSADFKSSVDLDFPIAVPRRHCRNAGDLSHLNRLLYVDLKLAIADNDLFKVNRMAALHGIEVRYPYLDPQVAVASGKIPAPFKLKGWQKRYIFKKAFADLLPQEILRKKKHGFGLPTGDWLRNHPGFRDFARSLLLDRRSVERGYFQRQALESLLRKHDEEKSGYYGSHIWHFMMLELWHRNHVDL